MSSSSPILRNIPLPIGDKIVNLVRPGYRPGEDPQEGTVTLPWIYYLTQQGQALGDFMPNTQGSE